MLAIDVLGPLTITSAGKLPKKARALLAYLACRQERVSRDLLADLLWPFQDQSAAHHSLRNCLLDVRKGLGGKAAHLISEFSACSLVDFQCDLNKIRDAGRDLRFSLMIRLYRGPLLDDTCILSEAWNEWLAVERERVKDMIVGSALDYGEEALRGGRDAQAVEAAKFVLHIDSSLEAGHQLLIRAHKSAGRDSAALLAYRQCSYAMRHEIGVMPDAETTRLAGGEHFIAGDPELRRDGEHGESSSSALYRQGFRSGYAKGLMRGYQQAIDRLQTTLESAKRKHAEAAEHKVAAAA